MKRVALLSAAILLANLGADGSQGLCGHDMEIVPETEETTDAPDGGTTDDGGTSDGGMADGGTGTSGKAPHLINKMTGEDLGLLIDLRTLTVFTDKVNAPIVLGMIRPRLSTRIYFSEPDCNGTRLIIPARYDDDPKISNLIFMIGPQSTYLQPIGDLLPNQRVGSYLTNSDGTLDSSLQCSNMGGVIMENFSKYVDTKVKRRPPDDQLKIELR